MIQYLEWSNHTLIIDLPTTITYQYVLWLYHVFSVGGFFDDNMISPYSIEGARGWISNSFGINFFAGYTYFITSDLSFGVRLGVRNEQVQYINNSGDVDIEYTTN